MANKKPFEYNLDESVFGVRDTLEEEITIEGNKYKGEVKNGTQTPHGRGKLTYCSGIWAGSVYEGYFKDGKCDGKGLVIWANGNYYEGGWVENKRTGRATLYMAGTEIHGRFKDGNYIGQ